MLASEYSLNLWHQLENYSDHSDQTGLQAAKYRVLYHCECINPPDECDDVKIIASFQRMKLQCNS